VNTLRWGAPHGVSFVQLRGLSPTLKSLRLSDVGIPTPEILSLICSFPLLEDLSFHSETPEGDTDGWTTPPTSPKLTGSLRMKAKNRSLLRGLLNLPGGLHFSKIRVEWRAEDYDSRTTTDLFPRCFDTLESLYVEYYWFRPPLDLSNAAKLKCVKFGWDGTDIRWITATLQTVHPEPLQRITVFLRNTLFNPTVEMVREWHELDRLLVQLWTSHSVRPMISYERVPGWIVPRLFPELAKCGLVQGRKR